MFLDFYRLSKDQGIKKNKGRYAGIQARVVFRCFGAGIMVRETGIKNV